MDIDYSNLIETILLYLPKAVAALVLLVLGFWLARRIANVGSRALQRNGVDPTIVPFTKSLITVLVKAMVLLTAASMFGVEITSFIALFSALALAIGLALQSNLGHFASGLLLLSLRPYKVGDVVTVGGQTGKVEAIQIFHTIIATPDNQRHIVPNGKITAETITNLSGQGTRGVDLAFGISYGDDIQQARDIILEQVRAHEFVLPEPEFSVVVTALADSSVNLLVRPFVLSQNWWATKVQLTERIKTALEAGGITIPFPQRSVWMEGGAPAEALAPPAATSAPTNQT